MGRWGHSWVGFVFVGDVSGLVGECLLVVRLFNRGIAVK